MKRTTLGTTELEVSVLGLGGGGTRRLGTAVGKSQDEAVALVREAVELGINFFDSSEKYGTEPVLGKAFKDIPRNDLVISTKFGPYDQDRNVKEAASLHESLNGSLERLGVEYVDLYHLHGVRPESYADVRDRFVPELERAQAQGKIRYMGATELFSPDPGHAMMQQAVQDDWDVIMVGFNLLNQSARQRVFPKTQSRGIGTIGMFAVRNALSDPAALREHLEKLTADGLVDAGSIDMEDPLGFLVRQGGAVSMVDAAYRFCLHEPGLDTVLCGTSSLEHLRENAASAQRGPLSEPLQRRLGEIFGRVDTVSGH